MKKIITLLFLLSACFSAMSENYAVSLYSGDPNGIPDGWPKTKRSLGNATGPLEATEQLMTDVQLAAQYQSLTAAMNAWQQRQATARAAPLVLAEAVRQRIAGSEFASLKIDALQSELISLLVKSYVRHMRLLELVTKAVAGTSATNNLTAGERTLVQSIRSEPSMGDGTAVTAADVARFVNIRDNTLTPHYQLYLAAKAIVDAWKTNAVNAPDPYTQTNLPSVTIGD